MIDHGVFITQLATAATALEGRAHDVAQYLRDAPAWPETPVAYVYPLLDDPGEDYKPVCNRQSVTATLAILIVVAASGASAQAFDALLTARASIKSALLGWLPAGCFDSVLFAGGQLEELFTADPKAGLPATLVWRDLYTCRYLLTP